MRRYFWPGVTLAFFVGIFALSFTPFEYDVWFHLKAGEIFTKLGIIRHDVFSYTAFGRRWYPYEWLFQITIYRIKEFFGLSAVKIFLASISTILIYLYYYISKKIYTVSNVLALILSFALFVSVYDFFTVRPQLPAHVLLLGYLLTLLLYVRKNVNLLWITIPITLIWANIHGTVVYAVYLSAAYAGVSYFYYRGTRLHEWRRKAAALGGLSVLTAILSVLPPIGTMQYQLLWLFWQKRDTITRFIDEWRPLNTFALDLTPFWIVTAAVGVLTMLVFIKKRQGNGWMFLLPLIPFVAAPVVAVRNLFVGYIILFIIAAWALSRIDQITVSWTRWLVRCVAAGAIIAAVILLMMKRDSERIYLPDGAVQFLKTHHINGNMYNGFGVGGYLLYHLYPEYKVFIDGRADVYLCCEIPDVVDFLAKKELPTPQYKKLLAQFFDKYAISFVIHTTKRNTASRRLGQVLQDDPDWSLVYWGDDFQILVWRDGKNDAVIGEFGATAARPLELTPYREGMEEKALAEYQRMIEITDSARSRNAIGLILMKRGDIAAAREELERAIAIKPLFDSPYMNLGELAVADGNIKDAIILYEKALSLVEDRGFTYIRLGQLYKDSGNEEEARRIWQRGLNATISDESKNSLLELLNTL